MSGDSSASQKASKASAPSTKRSKRPLWQKIVLGLVALVVAVIVLAYVASNGAAKVSNEFLKDIQSKQADQAYSLFSKEAKDSTDQTTFRETVDRIGPLLNTKAKQTGRQVQDSTGSPARAQVTYEIKGTDGVNYKITIQLVKQDDEWKVNAFDSSKQ